MIARDPILVTAAPSEPAPGATVVVDVFDALNRQFFWAGTVMGPPDMAADEQEVLEGEVVWHDGHT